MMNQSSPVLVTVGTGSSKSTGIVEMRAAALELAAPSKWPVPTSTTTQTSTVTITPAWTTLPTVTLLYTTTKTKKNDHTTITVPRTHSKNKRAEPTDSLTLLPDGSLGTILHKHTTTTSTRHKTSFTTVTPTVTHVSIHSPAPSITRQQKFITATSTTGWTTIPPTTMIIPGTVVTGTIPATPVTDAVPFTTLTGTTPRLIKTVVVPPSLSQLSATSIKQPTTVVSTVHESITTTAVANGAVVPIITSTATSTHTQPHSQKSHHRDLAGRPCPTYHFGCDPFDFINKNWFWLLAIPLILLAAAMWIFFRRSRPRDGTPSSQEGDQQAVVAMENGERNGESEIGKREIEGREPAMPSRAAPRPNLRSVAVY